MNKLPKKIDICGIDYIRADSIQETGDKVKPHSYIRYKEGHSTLYQVCPNDYKSWGNVSVSRNAYKYCPACGCEIDQECFIKRIEKYREMKKSGNLVDGYIFGDDE